MYEGPQISSYLSRSHDLFPVLVPGTLFLPHDVVDDLGIALDNLDDLGADTVVDVVGGHRCLGAIVFHGAAELDGLDDVGLGDAADDDGAFVEDFGAFGAGADEDAGETEHGGFFGEGAAVGEDAVGVHLEVVVVEKAEGLELLDEGVELEAAFGDFFPAAGVGGVDDR